MFETFLAQRICLYVGELESLGLGWKHKPRRAMYKRCINSIIIIKPRAQIKSSKKDSNKKNDHVRRRSDAMIFELLR